MNFKILKNYICLNNKIGFDNLKYKHNSGNMNSFGMITN